MHHELSDSELVRSLSAASDQEKKDIFLALYDRYKNLVLKVAYHYVHDYDRAADLMHDVFLRVIQKGEGIKDPGLFKSWIMTVTRNICVDSLRKTSYLTELDPSVDVTAGDRVEDALIAGMDMQKIVELLSECIKRLEDFDHQVFKLRWQGLKAARVCKILAADRPEIRRSYDRIKRILETCMQRKGLEISIDRILSLGEIDE